MDPKEVLDKLKLTQHAGVVNLPNGAEISYNRLEVVMVVVLLFVLVLTFGQLRHRLVHWHMKGIVPGVALGMIITLIIQGALLMLGGNLLKNALGWQGAPRPVAVAIETGKEKLVEVLSDTDEIIIETSDDRQKATIGGIMESYGDLTSEEQISLQSLVCEY